MIMDKQHAVRGMDSASCSRIRGVTKKVSINEALPVSWKNFVDKEVFQKWSKNCF